MPFPDASPDPYHVVKTSADQLEAAGFRKWNESEKVGPGDKLYFTRNRSTLVAFTVGANYKSGGGFKVIGSHTDSPNLKVKPFSKRSDKSGGSSGMIQLGVECYGGGLWHTWFDRDLGVSGRVFVREGEGITQKLVKIDDAILRIPNLAIHLQTADERKAFKLNKEDHLAPIIASAVKDMLEGKSDETCAPCDEKDEFANDKEWAKKQEPVLLQLLAERLEVDVGDIIDFELNLFDVQPSSLGGARSEFVHAARLDNLASCYLSLRGLLDHVGAGGVEEDSDISMIASEFSSIFRELTQNHISNSYKLKCLTTRRSGRRRPRERAVPSSRRP